MGVVPIRTDVSPVVAMPRRVVLIWLVLQCVCLPVCFAGSASPPNYYHDSHWCGRGNLRYLEDADCVKVFPSRFARTPSAACPVSASGVDDSWQPDTGHLADFSVNTTALTELGLASNVCVTLVRRPVTGGVFYRHLCGSHDDTDDHAFETWSSSKIYAIANAGGHLHELCRNSGLSARTITGAHGPTPLGDLATIIVCYDQTMGYASNGLSAYFHNVGWRSRMLGTVRQWFPGQLKLELGGNYGMLPPADLPLVFQPVDAPGAACTVANDTTVPLFLTLLTLPNSLL
jgi:hypothetical protein